MSDDDLPTLSEADQAAVREAVEDFLKDYDKLKSQRKPYGGILDRDGTKEAGKILVLIKEYDRKLPKHCSPFFHKAIRDESLKRKKSRDGGGRGA